MEMQRLTEFGINRHIYPIIQKRGRVFEGDYIKKDVKGLTIFRATENSRWNLRCYKFMDFMATKIRANFEDRMYKLNPSLGKIKSSINDPRLEYFVLLMRPDLIYNIIEGINNPNGQFGKLSKPYYYSPKISIKSLAKELKWMKSDVIATIKMISEYKFKTEYKFYTTTLYGDKLKKTYKHSYNNFSENFEPIFNVDMLDDECIIKFNTGFGICFLHNLYVGGYQLFDDMLYSLSESAQILYRKKFLTWNNLTNVYLNIGSVFDFLGIKTKNKTNEKIMFEKIINELLKKTDVELVEKICDNRYNLSKGRNKKSDITPIKKYVPWDDLHPFEKVKISLPNGF